MSAIFITIPEKKKKKEEFDAYVRVRACVRACICEVLLYFARVTL